MKHESLIFLFEVEPREVSRPCVPSRIHIIRDRNFSSVTVVYAGLILYYWTTAAYRTLLYAIGSNRWEVYTRSVTSNMDLANAS